MPKIPERFIPLLIVFAVLVLMMPRTAKFNYDYRKGAAWPYETLVSQIDFPVLKTQEQMLSEMESSSRDIVPYYRFDEEVAVSVVRGVRGLDMGKYNSVKPSVIQSIEDIYSKGVIPEAKPRLDRKTSLSDEVLFIQKNKRALKYPTSEVYKVSDARSRLLASCTVTYPDINLDSLFRRSGVYEQMVPNLVFDHTMTELGRNESAAGVSPTLDYVNANQVIVSKGEVITPEIAQILDSYKAEYDKVFGYDGPRILLYLGNILIAIAIVVILYLSILFTNQDIFDDKRRYYYLLTVFLVNAFAAFLVERFTPGALYVVPFAVSAMYLQAFFRKRVVMPAYILSLLPLLIFSHSGMELFVMFLTGGIVTMLTFDSLSRGWKQFLNALILFGVELVVYLGFRLIDAGSTNIFFNILQIFMGSMLTVAFYPLIYIFEKIFNLVSTSRLEELTDTSNPLLQELNKKAPGTFQHCLQVANMAEAAARSIDANALLVRAGALYHDIGKMRNPLCFVENESSNPGARKYHDGMAPEESARDIIAHVTAGAEIARENKLPDVIRDFILTHHGTTTTAYFFNAYVEAGGDPSIKSGFRYPGPRPLTKEQAVLMICDSVEAASRSLTEFTPEAYDKFVEGIVGGKIREKQFDDADITIREIETVKQVLKKYLTQIYHERVAYPKAEN